MGNINASSTHRDVAFAHLSNVVSLVNLLKPTHPELPQELIALAGEYDPGCVYTLIHDNVYIAWRQLLKRIFGLEFDSSISECDIRNIYLDKCASEKLTHPCNSMIINLGYSLSESKIMCRGHNDYGQLGKRGTYFDTFQEIKDIPKTVVEIIQRRTYTILKSKDSGADNSYTLWLSGKNIYGQPGGYSINIREFTVMRGVPKNIARVICGERSVFVILDDGTLYGCGLNLRNQTGKYKDKFREIKGIVKNIEGVYFGGLHIIIKLSDGVLLSAGDNSRGQLGHGDYIDRPCFTVIKGLPRNIVDVVCGSQHTVIKLTDGTLMSCGANRCGQLGAGDNLNRCSFSKINGIPKNVSSVSCGDNHTMVKFTDRITCETKLMSCGENEKGQLGHGDCKNRNILTEVKLSAGEICGISCSYLSTLIKMSDGVLLSSGEYYMYTPYSEHQYSNISTSFIVVPDR